MENIAAKGIISLVPIVLTLFLAFFTKDAVFSLVIGCIAGVLIAGFDPATGLSKLFQHALGNGDFIWVLMIEVAIGIMIAFAFFYWVAEGIFNVDVFLDKLRFSFLTMLIPAYGVINAQTGVYGWLTILEAFIGAFTWPTFMVIFARKYMR